MLADALGRNPYGIPLRGESGWEKRGSVQHLSGAKREKSHPGSAWQVLRPGGATLNT